MPMQLLASRSAQALKPPPKLSVSEWADTERKLSPESSAEPGQWRTDRAPYQRGIMDAVNDPGIHTVVVMKSAQTGWTEILNNMVGYFIHHDPCPMLVIQPTLEMGLAWSKDRLAPMLRDSPALQGKVSDVRSKDSNNTLMHKTFSGGHITIAGANSPAGLSSRPIRVVLFDEVDRYPASAGAEGDPVSLASKRTTTFWNKKKLMGSTPTIKGASRIETAYESSDMRKYYVPCPHCEHEQTLVWRNVQWPKDEPEKAVYVCEECGSVLEESDKLDMLRAGYWWSAEECNGTAGFHISELYSPWSTWAEMAVAFVEAKKLPETLKTWINTALGETWEEDGDSVEWDTLWQRREHYGPVVPNKACVLVCGVDVQDDRLEAEVVAVDSEEESWSMDFRIFHGDPGKKDLWDKLDEYLLRTWKHESGAELKIAATCIDSGGHYTQHVYAFCKPRHARRVYAIKGKAGAGLPIVGRPSKSNLGKLPLYGVGVDTVKELIYGRLKIFEPGPGYCHYPVHELFDEEYFKQLTAEKAVTRYHKGFPRREWINTRKRNEALDCRVYAWAALYILRPVYKKIRAALERAAERAENPEQPASAPSRKKKRAKRRGKGFVHNWR